MSRNVSEGSGMGDSTDDVQTSDGRRAKVWEYFQEKVIIEDNVRKAVCKFCALKLVCTSGTSSLRNHIAKVCPKIDDKIRKSFLATIKPKPSEIGFVFDAKKSRRLMVKYCIHAEIPFRKFEDPYFEEWMESMQPTFKVVGRHTVRNDCVDEYEEMKEKLREELQCLDSRVCLTSDMWTSVQKLGYMCITAHYIDANFVLKKKIISFKDVKYPHTSAGIEEALTRSLTEWGIMRKLFTLTLDNATNNTGAVDEFLKNQDHGMLFGGADFHVRCCAHILNILVQDGTAYVHMAIEKIRDLLRHIDSSGARLQTFNELATNLGLPVKSGLALDIPNRWNTTYTMIMEALKYTAVLKSYAKEKGVPAPTKEEWENAEVICAFLKAFEEATKAVSADRKPTAHVYLHMLLCISNALRDPQWKVNEIMEVLSAKMSSKFVKYWEEVKLNDAVVIATILDPTKKLDYLDFFFEKYTVDVNDIERNIEYIKDTMKLYFQKYEESGRKGSEQSSLSRQAEFHQGSPVLGKRKIEEEFARYKSRRRAYVQPKSELDRYFDEHFENSDENFDILLWWKVNAEKYPVLSTMARDFLAIPLSTVSSESAFSCGGRILGESRTSLSPKSLEALVCGKDWLIKIPNNEGVGAEDVAADGAPQDAVGKRWM